MLLDTGLRLGETLSLEWPQVHLESAPGAKFGYITVLSGKAKSRKSRNVPISERTIAVLSKRGPRRSGIVFQREDGGAISESHLDQQHARVRKLLKLPADFVLHSLRHTFGTRLGIRSGRVHYHEIDGAFDGYRFSALCISVTRVG